MRWTGSIRNAYKILAGKYGGSRRKMRWTGKIKTHDVLAGKRDGKRPVVRSRHGWNYSVKIGIEEMGSTGFICLRTL